VICFLCMGAAKTAAQQAGRGGTEPLDSLIALLGPGEYDSLMQELDFFLNTYRQPEKSYFDISLGAGNGFFTQRGEEAVNAVPASRMVLMPSAAYFHKSGLGASWFGFLGTNGAGLYQHQVSLSYDYLKGKTIGFGVSYGRQFSKESVDFYTTPFNHVFSGYASLRKGWLRPALSVSYSTGGYTDVFTRIVGRPPAVDTFRLKYNVDVSDITVTASVKRQFVKKQLFHADDYFMFTPRLLLTGAGQNYTTYSPDTRFRRMLANGLVAPGGNSGFQVQSLGLGLSGDYFHKSFYLHPQISFDYFTQDAGKRFYTSVLLLAGFIL
jgi:hypothetical protein